MSIYGLNKHHIFLLSKKTALKKQLKHSSCLVMPVNSVAILALHGRFLPFYVSQSCWWLWFSFLFYYDSSSSRFCAFDGEYVFTFFWPQISGGFSVVFRIWRGTLLKFFLQLYCCILEESQEIEIFCEDYKLASPPVFFPRGFGPRFRVHRFKFAGPAKNA